VYVKVIVTSNLWLNIALMTLYQFPDVLGIVIYKVKQAIAVKIWIAHINSIQIKPMTKPAPNAHNDVHNNRAIYSQ
jgi:hypothetical protein